METEPVSRKGPQCNPLFRTVSMRGSWNNGASVHFSAVLRLAHKKNPGDNSEASRTCDTKRCEWDSNPRIMDLQSIALGHLATAPESSVTDGSPLQT